VARAPWGWRPPTGQGGGDGGSPKWRVDGEGEKAASVVTLRRRGAPPMATTVTSWSTRKQTEGVRWGPEETHEGGGGDHKGGM
jgi:hypothetical protein